MTPAKASKSRRCHNNTDAAISISLSVEDVPFGATQYDINIVRILRSKLPQLIPFVPTAGNQAGAAHQEPEPAVADPVLAAMSNSCNGADDCSASS